MRPALVGALHGGFVETTVDVINQTDISIPIPVGTTFVDLYAIGGGEPGTDGGAGDGGDCAYVTNVSPVGWASVYVNFVDNPMDVELYLVDGGGGSTLAVNAESGGGSGTSHAGGEGGSGDVNVGGSGSTRAGGGAGNTASAGGAGSGNTGGLAGTGILPAGAGGNETNPGQDYGGGGGGGDDAEGSAKVAGKAFARVVFR